MSSGLHPCLVACGVEVRYVAWCLYHIKRAVSYLQLCTYLFTCSGGAFPYTIGRIEHGFNVRPDLCATENPFNPRCVCVCVRVRVRVRVRVCVCAHVYILHGFNFACTYNIVTGSMLVRYTLTLWCTMLRHCSSSCLSLER